ncbi:MAG TPA: hypothetical protein PKE63_05915 [Lacibacter sp.]|nr:hypothetical protein [Lacibacter sp.]HMO88539.1 hypothetical protein [Lacibacter sp.]HMP86794.1 hypothetical protein [Lacibacter sp.]
MKPLSVWASRHPILARVLIVLLHIPLNLIALRTGYQLFEAGVVFSPWVLNTIAMLTVVLLLSAGRHLSFRKRKVYHFLFGSSTFAMVAFFGNQYNHPQPYLPFAVNSQAVSAAIAIDPITHTPVTKKEVAREKRAAKKQLRNKMRAFIQQEVRPKYKKSNILLWIFAALVIIAAIAAIACLLSCTASQSLGMIGLMVLF